MFIYVDNTMKAQKKKNNRCGSSFKDRTTDRRTGSQDYGQKDRTADRRTELRSYRRSGEEVGQREMLQILKIMGN